MTATIINLSEARKKQEIIRDAKAAMQRLFYSDPLAAWYSMGLLSLTEHKPELPCDVEP